MFCSNCGFKRNGNEKFCGECGHRFLDDKKVENTGEIKVYSQPQNSESFKNVNPHPIVYPQYNQNNYRPKSSNKIKILTSVLVIVLVVFVATFLIVLGINKSFRKGKRTIMIYMVGSDLETNYSLATADIYELIENDIDYEKVNVLIYTGGAKKWAKEEVSNKYHIIFKVSKNGIEKLKEFKDENDMTKTDNLTEFLNYGYQKFKAEKYSLIFWNHGAGPIYGFGVDEVQQKIMSVRKIKTALDNSPFGKNNKLELIGFDACIMGNLEVAYSLKDYAEYLISSQEIEPGMGWNYNFLSKIKSDTSTKEIATDITNQYFNMAKSYNLKGLTLAFIDLSKIDNVTEKFNNLFKKIYNNFDDDYYTISRIRATLTEFGKEPNVNSNYELVDIIEFVNKLPDKYKVEKEELVSSIEEAVIFQKTDLKHANGLSIFFPYYDKNYTNSLVVYNGLDFSQNYYKLIRDFSKRKFSGSGSILRTPEVVNYNKDEISIDVSDKLIKSYSVIKYLIFEKTTDKYYTPIYVGSDIEVNGNTISTKLEKKALKVSTSKGEMYLSTFESVLGNDFIKYKIPVMLQKFNEEDFSIDVVDGFMEFIVDSEHPEGYISTIIKSSENNIPSKTNLNYKDYDYINLMSYKYKVKDDNGNYLEKWEGSKEVMMFEVSTKDDFKISYSTLDSTKEYTAIFRIKDVEDNIFNSQFVDIK